MKIVLAGSPQIALQTFEKVINKFNVVAIITQPDRKSGRGQEMHATAVADLGEKYNIPVKKPEQISQLEDYLKSLEYDILLTFAYGQILPEAILQTAKMWALNIHGSLLPKYRGAAPIQRAVLAGEKELGVSLIEMIKKMDAGDIFFTAQQVIDQNKTTSKDGFNIISKLADENIDLWLNKIKNNDFQKIDQGKNYTLAPKIKKSEAEINISQGINIAMRKILAFNPFPGAFIYLEKKRVKLFAFSQVVVKNALKIEFEDGVLYITDYQFESKKRISI